MSYNIQKFKPTSARLRVFYVPHSYILFLFSNGIFDGDHLRVPKAMNLSESARVCSMWIDEMRRSIGFLVEDERFDEVPEGMMCPEIRIEWDHVVIAANFPGSETLF